MLVRNRMTKNPVTIGPQEMLATAQEKMTTGRFRRLPVVENGALVGILTDRDVNRYVGVEERTKVRAAMTETPLTISPDMPIEEATQLLLKHQIGGLPVVDDGKLVGILTTSDILQTFLEMMGSSDDSHRIDVLAKEGGSLPEAAHLIEAAGGSVLSVGTYSDPAASQRIFFVRARGIDPQRASTALRNKGYTVVTIH
jgi:acetoin utilization protein AcuB